MTRPYYQPAPRASADGVVVDITPATAQWQFSSLRTVELASAQSYHFDTGDSEWIVLPLRGGCRVRCDGQEFDLEGRTSVFERVSDFVYLPRDATVTITSHEGGGRFALTGARARRRLPVRYGAAEDVPIELRGAGHTSRQCNNFASPEGFDTDRLIAVEVITPGGNWSSYPPHKHDERRPGESRLEEIYYFEVADGPRTGGVGPGGYQRVYSSGPDRQIDVLAEVSTGDTIIIPHGYHGPTMAAPGYDLYFLNVLAGDETVRTMSFSDDPAHAWIRSSWSDLEIDPRLPMTTHRGRT